MNGGEASPLFSILMPVYNTPAYALNCAIASVLSQSFADWQLCICDDCSSSAETLAVLDYYTGIDPRVKIIRSPKNLHISGATNLAASVATGKYVGFLDHDDMLATSALFELYQAIERDPDADVLYSDEDKIEFDGSFSEPYLKPDWSPEHLSSVMYILHFFVLNKKLFDRLGGLQDAYSGAQDYDLALRATAEAEKIVHIRSVLYHWRKIAGSAAAELSAKPTALLNARRALEAFVGAKDPAAKVEGGQVNGTFRVRWPVDVNEPVTLLILTAGRSRKIEQRGNIILVENFVESILKKSTFKNYKLLIIDNGDLSRSVSKKLTGIGARLVSYRVTEPFNFSHKMNFAIDHVDTEYVVMLNDDLEVIAADWIEELLSYVQQPDIGAVGAKLLYPNGRIQHAGIVFGINNGSAHIFHNLQNAQPAYCCYSHIVRNYSAVTGAVLATKMSVIKQVGRFDLNLRVDYNDLDFCLRIGEAGFRVVYTPHAELFHFEGASIQRAAVDPADKGCFFSRWQRVVDCDPYYNPRLPRTRLDCGIDEWSVGQVPSLLNSEC